jgi:hypothetical protein
LISRWIGFAVRNEDQLSPDRVMYDIALRYEHSLDWLDGTMVQVARKGRRASALLPFYWAKAVELGGALVAGICLLVASPAFLVATQDVLIALTVAYE